MHFKCQNKPEHSRNQCIHSVRPFDFKTIPMNWHTNNEKSINEKKKKQNKMYFNCPFHLFHSYLHQRTNFFMPLLRADIQIVSLAYFIKYIHFVAGH